MGKRCSLNFMRLYRILIKDGIIYYNKFNIGINYDGKCLKCNFMPTTQVILQESVWQIINS